MHTSGREQYIHGSHIRRREQLFTPGRTLRSPGSITVNKATDHILDITDIQLDDIADLDFSFKGGLINQIMGLYCIAVFWLTMLTGQ